MFGNEVPTLPLKGLLLVNREQGSTLSGTEILREYNAPSKTNLCAYSTE